MVESFPPSSSDGVVLGGYSLIGRATVCGVVRPGSIPGTPPIRFKLSLFHMNKFYIYNFLCVLLLGGGKKVFTNEILFVIREIEKKKLMRIKIN
jgi:hypothetical protein